MYHDTPTSGKKNYVYVIYTICIWYKEQHPGRGQTSQASRLSLEDTVCGSCCKDFLFIWYKTCGSTSSDSSTTITRSCPHHHVIYLHHHVLHPHHHVDEGSGTRVICSKGSIGYEVTRWDGEVSDIMGLGLACGKRGRSLWSRVREVRGQGFMRMTGEGVTGTKT